MGGVEGVATVLLLVGHQLPLLLIWKAQACFSLYKKAHLVAGREKAMAPRLEGEGGVGGIGRVKNGGVPLLGLGFVGDAVLGEVDGFVGGEGGHDEERRGVGLCL